MTIRRAKLMDAALVRVLFDYEDGELYWRKGLCAPRLSLRTPAGTFGQARGQGVISYDGAKYSRARVVWAWHYGEWPAGYLRHLNGKSADDRIENLMPMAFHNAAPFMAKALIKDRGIVNVQ